MIPRRRSVENIKKKAVQESSELLASVENLARRIADRLSEIDGREFRVIIDCDLEFVMVRCNLDR